MMDLPMKRGKLRERITLMLDDETHEMIETLENHPMRLRVPEILRGILRDGLPKVLEQVKAG